MQLVINLSIILLLITATSCYKEEVINPVPKPIQSTLAINGQQCAFDKENGIYYFSILDTDTVLLELSVNYPTEWGVLNYDNKEVQSGSSIIFKSIQLNNPIDLNFSAIEHIKLAFLTVPIISVYTDSKINDDVASNSYISVIEPRTTENKQNIASTIKIRGGHSKSLPKNGYKIELFEDASYAETMKLSIANLREDDDWILDAMYIDPMRMRNRVSFDLWFKMVAKSDYLMSSNSTNGINGVFTVLFINNSCMGIYCLNERFDKKQFKVRDTHNNYGGVLYKGKSWEKSVKFIEYVPFTDTEYSNGWKLLYPNVDENYIQYWSHLDTLSRFIVNSDDVLFKENFHKHMNIRNIVDYYILLNLTLAHDNTAKNIILSKYNEYVPFVLSPWDLDGTWGLLWDGSHIDANEILDMTIVKRLVETSTHNFSQQLTNTWSDYRSSFITTDSIVPIFDSYLKKLQQNKLYELENNIWELQLNPEEELVFIENWINDRLVVLDDFFQNLK